MEWAWKDLEAKARVMAGKGDQALCRSTTSVWAVLGASDVRKGDSFQTLELKVELEANQSQDTAVSGFTLNGKIFIAFNC